MHTSEAGRADEGVASTRLVEAVVAVLVLAFGVLVIAGSWTLGSGWTSDGPGAGYFPFYIGLILCLSGAGILVQALRHREPEGAEPFVTRQQFGRVLAVLVPAAFYVLAVQFVGIYVASAVYIALFMIVLGKYPRFKSVLLALAVMGLFYALFEVWFKVPLYKGAFNVLGLLGL